mmetsp:Transcript_31340/g.75742  ORF Transcript_31340/g.75742 Transcript_31340/m.75742 type:complete len:236 (-) Transcript_31340:1152-1859(-)
MHRAPSHINYNASLLLLLNLLHHVMQLLQKLLHILRRHLHDIRIETIEPKHSPHALGRQLEVLAELVPDHIARLLGILVPHDHERVRSRLLSEKHQGTGLCAGPLAILAMHIHEEVGELCQDEGFGEGVETVVAGALLAGGIRRDGPRSAFGTSRRLAASAGTVQVGVTKVTQSGNGIPVHEIPRCGHDIPLQRHCQPNPGSQPRCARHVPAVHQVGEVGTLRPALCGGQRSGGA